MRKKINCIVVLFAACFISCQKEDGVAFTQQEFVATLPTALSKTTVTDYGKVSWEMSDAIGIFDENVAAPVKATIKSISSDGKSAVFTPATEIANAVGAIYPYDANATMADNSTVSTNLGPTRNGTFSDANVSAARASGFNLSFKNVTAVFKFKITDEAAKSIKISAPKVAGTMNITIGSLVTASINESTATDEITLSNITANTDYYVAVVPKEYSNFTYSWYDGSGNQLGSATLGKAVTIYANTLYTWGDLKEHKDKEIISFEDNNFKAYCVDNFDSDGDGEISKEEALAITRIEVDTKDITSVKEIKYFTNLEYLDCSLKHPATEGSWSWYGGAYHDWSTGEEQVVASKLSSLDVSFNAKLTDLFCYGNGLLSIDISNNTVLTKLDCGQNSLGTLDVSKNTNLTSLSCSSNKLATLDVSKNTELALLDCSNNQLSSLDVSKNTNLTSLSCSSNKLATLDVSKNTELALLGCSNNQLSSLDVSKNTNLTSLSCSGNKLATLDVSKNTELALLDCSNNQLSSLDVSKNTKLEYLPCELNQMHYIYVWKGFDDTQCFIGHDYFAMIVEVGDSAGEIEDYNIEDDPWGEGAKNVEFVDFNLPSGLKWAKCNIGATSPEDPGDYFAWGETHGHKANAEKTAFEDGHDFGWETCPFNNCWQSYNSGYFSSNKSTWVTNNKLRPEYDAAHVSLGGTWRIPTTSDFYELLNKTTKTWTDDYDNTGVPGYIFTSKTDNTKSIFLPTAGSGSGTRLSFYAVHGFYWSSSLSINYADKAFLFDFTNAEVSLEFVIDRYEGFPIRPVAD